MEVDIKQGTWRDIYGGSFRITELVSILDTTLIWYVDLQTSETHCMSIDIFLRQHEACGSYIMEKTS